MNDDRRAGSLIFALLSFVVLLGVLVAMPKPQNTASHDIHSTPNRAPKSTPTSTVTVNIQVTETPSPQGKASTQTTPSRTATSTPKPTPQDTCETTGWNVPKSSPKYRVYLDSNHNGIACEKYVAKPTPKPKPAPTKTMAPPVPPAPKEDSCANGDYSGSPTDGKCGTRPTIKTRDNCTNGDWSGNYFDGKCGTKSTYVPPKKTTSGSGSNYQPQPTSKQLDNCPTGDYTGSNYDGSCGTKPADKLPSGCITPSNYNVQSAATAEMESRIHVLVNNYRAKNGAQRLGRDGTLDVVSRSWSVHMAKTEYMQHNPCLGRQTPVPWSRVGENVGFTSVQSSPEATANALFTAWINSPHHRANILSPIFNSDGIGVWRSSNGEWYATQDFSD